VCLAVALGIILAGGYYAINASRGTEIKTGIMLFCLCVPLIVVWMPISDQSKVKKLLYAVTDKMVLIVSKDNDKPLTMRLADIDAIRVDQSDKGNCHVRVASPVFKAALRKLPGLACRGEFVDQDGNKMYKGLVLFNVSAEDGKVISNLLQPAAASA
jgi:hypothetical protein